MTAPNDTPRQPPMPLVVQDSRGVRYSISQRDQLGKVGGFAVTYGVGEVAIKLYKEGLAQDRRTIDQLKRLPIGDLRVARPLDAIEGEWPGLVLELVPGMLTWSPLVLAIPPRERTFMQWWNDYGGFAQRLNWCLNLAQTMAALSERGLVFADLNPNNVLLDLSNLDSSETWLIDVDNLRFGSASPLAFPGYSAPEVWNGEPTTLMSDAWSLATLVFTTLTSAHPFESGEYVYYGDPDLEGVQANFGLVPWIDDPKDHSNHGERGLERRKVLTSGLRGYFEQMFGPGRKDRLSRPSAGSLLRELETARLLTVTCPVCGQTAVARTLCPYCETDQQVLLLSVQWQPVGLADREAHNAALGQVPSEPWFVAPEYIALGPRDTQTPPAHRVAFGDSVNPVVRFTRNGKGKLHILRNADGPVMQVRKAGKRWTDLDKITELRDTDSWDLRIGSESEPHVVIRSNRDPSA